MNALLLVMPLRGAILPGYDVRPVNCRAAGAPRRRLAGLGRFVLLSFASLPLLLGQPQATPAFEVTSVKPVTEMRRGGDQFSCSNGRFVNRRHTLRYMILWAWNIQLDYYRLIGLPSWAVSPGLPEYDVEARAAGPISEDECRLMLRTLLADRFQLTTHEEDRRVDAYALVIAKNGPRIRQVTSPDAPPNGPGFTMDGQPNQVYEPALKGWSMAQLASALSMRETGLGRRVVDRTGLKGIYRIDLKFRVGIEGNDPDIRSALKDQLGLELVASKETIKMLVVDRIARPDPN